MNNVKIDKTLHEIVYLLNDLDLTLTDDILQQLQLLTKLIEEWNVRSGLCSTSELPYLWERHILDSLSLLPYLPTPSSANKNWLDIGCGGGFPLLPCKLFRPEIPVLAIERTEKKIAYLHFAIAQLHLKNITLCHGAFPQVLPKDFRPSVITARAVEKPETWAKALVPLIKDGAVFLCQQPEVPVSLTKLFHVEQIDDTWSKKGFRRGILRLIQV